MFKVGDKVKRIGGVTTIIPRGAIATVTAISPCGGLIALREFNGIPGETYPFQVFNFELTHSTSPQHVEKRQRPHKPVPYNEPYRTSPIGTCRCDTLLQGHNRADCVYRVGRIFG